ncbi:MAG: hypothetical protein ACJ748_02330 [Flavisolibacter sp.]
MRKIFLIVLLFSFFQSLAQDRNLIKERNKLKNYAFCKCLFYSDTSQKQFFINDGSSAGYFETSTTSLIAFQKLDSLAKIFALKKYISKEKRKLSIMKCLDFYNSKILMNKIKSMEYLIVTHHQP